MRVRDAGCMKLVEGAAAVSKLRKLAQQHDASTCSAFSPYVVCENTGLYGS